MDRLALWIDRIGRAAAFLAALSAVVLALLIVYDASMRYLFHEGSVALQELEWHLFDLLFLFGLAYALQHDKHVRVDILYDRFPARWKERVRIITMLLFVIPFAALTVYFGWDFTLQSYLQQEASPDPGGLCCRWIVKGAVVVAFLTLILQAVGETIKAWRRLKALKGVGR